MNRYKKEQFKLRKKMLVDKSSEEIAELKNQNKIIEKIEALAKKLHLELFSEEYDFMYDNYDEYKQRLNKNINPMSLEYIENVNKKRISHGFQPLPEDGLAENQETLNYCYYQAIHQLKTNWL
ncbi:MAG: hypothetical protein HQL46_11935 [Gammaproteobacteria bacterium]|nr:hypothetical protein [Gammaproteobacteria bacterium]